MASLGPSAGVIFLKIGGAQVQLRGSVTIDVTSLEATEAANLDGSIYYTEKPTAPMIDCELSDWAGLSLTALGAIRNTTITAELANGKVYVLGNGLTSGRVALNADTGAVKIKFAGTSVNEIGVTAS